MNTKISTNLLNHLDETSSTNIKLWEIIRKNRPREGFTLCCNFQTDGKGQTGNSWESVKSKNLLFSMVLYPHSIEIEEQFIISQIVSLAVVKVLHQFDKDFSVKWPNDIYWKDKKIGGILIENVLKGQMIDSCVIGIGLNINQTDFTSQIPNPVSLKQITGFSHKRQKILGEIHYNILESYKSLNKEIIREEYMQNLYRRDGVHLYKADNKTFEAKIKRVQNDGGLTLELKNSELKTFYFKEVSILL